MVEKATVECVFPWLAKAAEVGAERLLTNTKDGQRGRDEVKGAIMPGYWIHDQTGTVMGYRYNGSPIVIPDLAAPEPSSAVDKYTPSTWPGARAPHVFLSNGTAIFDCYGPGFSIVDFTRDGRASQDFAFVASKLSIPITQLHLPEETHCKAIWERDVVLVRPDGFVSWRCSPEGFQSVNAVEIERVLLIAIGRG